MALKEHLGYSRSCAKARVYLIYRPQQSEEIRTGLIREEIAEALARGISILSSCVKRHFVSVHPSAGIVAASVLESRLSGVEPRGSSAVYQRAGVQTHELRYVSVVGIISERAVIILFSELLDLTGETNVDGIVLIHLLHYSGEDRILLL